MIKEINIDGYEKVIHATEESSAGYHWDSLRGLPILRPCSECKIPCAPSQSPYLSIPPC